MGFLIIFLFLTYQYRDTVTFFLSLLFKVNQFLSTTKEKVSTTNMSMMEVAMGFINVANEAMCRPIRALTQVVWVKKITKLVIY